jgi:hypothetical protein
MDRDPLGWTVKRHVVDVAFRELDAPRHAPGRGRADRYLLVLQARTDERPEDSWSGPFASGQDLSERVS